MQTRLLLGPSRSGTSYLQSFICSLYKPETLHGLYEPVSEHIKIGNQHLPNQLEKLIPNFLKANRILLIKEVIARTLKSRVDEVKNIVNLDKSKPVFVFKEPNKTWASIKKRNWMDFSSFLDMYKQNLSLVEELRKKKKPVLVINFEEFLQDKEYWFEKIKKFWRLPEPDANLLDLVMIKPDPFGNVYRTERMKRIMESKDFHKALLEGTKNKTHVISPLENLVLKEQLAPRLQKLLISNEK